MKHFLMSLFAFAFVVFAILGAACFFLPDPSAGDVMLGEMGRKIERLRTAPSPRIVFVGGSGCSHGIDSPRIERELGVTVVNTGLHAALGLVYQLNVVRSGLRPDDMVVVIPEWQQFSDSCMGNMELVGLLMDVRPSDRKIVGLAQWLHLLRYMPTYAAVKLRKSLKRRRRHDALPYNAQGDMIGAWNVTRPEPFQPQGSLDALAVDETCVRALCAFGNAHGVRRVVVLPPAYQASSYDASTNFIAAVDRRLARAGLPFAAPPLRYRVPDEDCFDTPYHLNGPGVARRTDLLIEDLRRLMR